MKHHRRWVHIFLILAILFSGLAFSLASVHPVSAQSGSWYVSTAGSDSNACSAPESPCLTIKGAIAKAASGDTVKVAVGTYAATSGSVVVWISKSITLSGGWNEGFTAQSGRATVDGGGVRRGIEIYGYPSLTVVIDRFIIQNGFVENDSGGGVYNDFDHTLTLSNSIVRRNKSQQTGGGIYNSSGSTLTIINTTISGNSVVPVPGTGGRGGGVGNDRGTVTIDNSTVSGNKVTGDGDIEGSGIYSNYTFILNNSTVSGNTNGYEGIGIEGGTFILNNSTVTGHYRGITNRGGTVSLQNSVVAGNGTGGDCYNASFPRGTITSQGYNLIGNATGCAISPTTGDLVGTISNSIDPRLGPLQNNGGPTFTHALLGNSPALNAGNPAEPGTGGNTCLTTDQRGAARPEGSACDIGAYELDVPIVKSIQRLDTGFTTVPNVNFSITFTVPVTGVDLVEPFNDFALATSGVTGAHITSVSGSDNAYTITVNTGTWSENATIRLDVIDDDSILDSSGRPLGDTGAGNGSFTSGPAYTLTRTPNPLFPKNNVMDKTPTFKWTRIGGVLKYQFSLLRGTQVIYTVTVPASNCGAFQCTSTPTTRLENGAYTWKVRAWVEGRWQSYSPAKAFKVIIPTRGFWSDPRMEFYVTTFPPKVDNFSFYINVRSCGTYKVTYNPPVEIKSLSFSFKGSIYAYGRFTSPTRASGGMGLYRHYIPGCGYVTGGQFSWSAVWKNSSRPTMSVEGVGDLSVTPIPDLGLLPDLQLPFDAFTVEPVE